MSKILGMKALLSIVVFSLSLYVSAAEKSVYDFPLKDIDSKATSLKAHKGKVILIVNVASVCGLTPQYKQLQSVYQKYGSTLSSSGVFFDDVGPDEHVLFVDRHVQRPIKDVLALAVESVVVNKPVDHAIHPAAGSAFQSPGPRVRCPTAASFLPVFLKRNPLPAGPRRPPSATR